MSENITSHHVLTLIKGLGRGGAELLAVSAIRHGDHERFRYDVAYLLPEKGALVEELQSLGATVHCLGTGIDWPWRLRRLVRERRIDLIHAHSPAVATAARVALPPRLPFVYTEHNVWERYRPPTYWGNLLTLPRTSRVLAVSEHVRLSIRYPQLLKFLPMPPVETLLHGIEPEFAQYWSSLDGVRKELGISPRAPVVGVVANMKAHKGLEYLLRAIPLIQQSFPDVRIVLVGRGPIEGDIRQEVQSLGLEDAVIFAGYRTDAPRVAGAFDVFTLPSIHEGLSIALIEAMALGKPAVVTRVGGLPEVVENGKQGFVVPPREPSALASAIVWLLHDAHLRARMGAAARVRAADFDIRKAVCRIEQIYEELLV